MKNVLVFPCGSEIGLEINRSLAHSKHFKLFGASSTNDHGRFVYENYVEGLPFVDDPEFIPAFKKVLAEYSIDFVFPAHDSVVLKLAANRAEFSAEIITAELETCQICRSKKSTYGKFESILPLPAIYSLGDQYQLPVFLKPDVGQGSRGTQIAHTSAEVEFFLRKDPSLLILEYLPGKEFTIDCFTDRHGKLLFAQGRERRRIYGGISVNSVRVDRREFLEYAQKINRTMNMRGAWFYQVKERQNGELVLMEIAPRIAGTMALYRVEGINFAQMSLFDRMNVDVAIQNNGLKPEIDRALIARYNLNFAYQWVYLDLDDTLVEGSKVNTDVIKLIYQWRNQDKQIVLLTRHKYDVAETLARKAIDPALFEEIIKLDAQSSKADFIKHKDAIFIDDSFAERAEVAQKTGIPVFGLDALEVLFYWKV